MVSPPANGSPSAPSSSWPPPLLRIAGKHPTSDDAKTTSKWIVRTDSISASIAARRAPPRHLLAGLQPRPSPRRTPTRSGPPRTQGPRVVSQLRRMVTQPPGTSRLRRRRLLRSAVGSHEPAKLGPRAPSGPEPRDPRYNLGARAFGRLAMRLRSVQHQLVSAGRDHQWRTPARLVRGVWWTGHLGGFNIEGGIDLYRDILLFFLFLSFFSFFWHSD